MAAVSSTASSVLSASAGSAASSSSSHQKGALTLVSGVSGVSGVGVSGVSVGGVSAAHLEVESSDVIKLIMQFLKENNLLTTLRALQDESQVTLNTVDNVDRFGLDILHGRWDSVLEVTSTLRLPTPSLVDLYEQIVLELAELRELDTARALLRSTAAMLSLKKDAPDRYLRLEHLLQRTYFDYADAYPAGTSKEKRRQQIAQALKKEVYVVPPSRLLALISQSLKWQQYQGLLPKGSKYDLFRGAAPTETIEEEKVPGVASKIIKFGTTGKSYPEIARFTPDGQYLVSGSSDGFVEVYDFDTGKLAKELKYQAEDDFMMHESNVLSLAFSRDSELIASGDASGKIKVWRLRTGTCIRKFLSAHSKGVTSLEFARDGTQLLSASHDHTVRIHGLKSGRTLKEFRGHTSFVHSAIYSEDNNQIISGSADGSVRVWDAKTTDCIKTYKPAGSTSSTNSAAITSISRIRGPVGGERVLICSRSPVIRCTTLDGQIMASYSLTSADVVAVASSPKAHFVYGVGDDHVLYCFGSDSSKVEHIVKLHEKEVVGVAHHPHRNIFASYSQDGTLKIWRP